MRGRNVEDLGWWNPRSDVYDVKKVVTPGQPTEVLFTADVPGQVELELEQSRTTLVRLVIS